MADIAATLLMAGMVVAGMVRSMPGNSTNDLPRSGDQIGNA
jgi:hypothetical protein